jgi:hypothetical protein
LTENGVYAIIQLKTAVGVLRGMSMGLSIGQTAIGLSNATVLSPVNGGGAASSISAARGSRDSAPTLFQEDPAPVPGAGFGEGTVSGPVAALHSLSKTVEGVRESIPTIQELRVQFQLEAARERDAQRAARREELIARFFQRVENRVPDPAPQARNFAENAPSGLQPAGDGQEAARSDVNQIVDHTDQTSNRPDEADRAAVETPATNQTVVAPTPQEPTPAPQPPEPTVEAPRQEAPAPNTPGNRIDISV